MLLQKTVVAVNVVKLKTQVCIACTLVCTINRHAMASILPYTHPFLTILCATVIFENEFILQTGDFFSYLVRPIKYN